MKSKKPKKIGMEIDKPQVYAYEVFLKNKEKYIRFIEGAVLPIKVLKENLKEIDKVKLEEGKKMIGIVIEIPDFKKMIKSSKLKGKAKKVKEKKEVKIKEKKIKEVKKK